MVLKLEVMLIHIKPDIQYRSRASNVVCGKCQRESTHLSYCGHLE